MNICPKCGRQLADGEICNCAAQNPQQNIPYPQQSGAPYGQPVPPQYPPGYNYHPQTPPQKKGLSTGCIIALVIGVIGGISMAGILAAILVPAMLGYVKKSNYSKANLQASSVMKAANSALVDLDSQGELEALGRNFVICSEPNSDFNADSDTAKLHQLVEQYLPADPDGKEWDYFFVVEDYTCVYAAASRTDQDLIGSYPAGYDFLPKRYDGMQAPKDWTINDLYTNAVTNLPTQIYDDDDDWNYDDDWDDDQNYDGDDWDEDWYFDED